MIAEIEILGETFEVNYDFKITAPSIPEQGPSYSSGGEPACACEFEIIWARLERAGKAFDTPKWLEALLKEYLYEDENVIADIQDAEHEEA